MNARRPLIVLLAAAALAATATSAPAKETKKPTQTGRLALTISRVGPKTPVNQPVEVRSRVRWSGAKARLFYQWTSLSGALPDGVDEGAKDVTIPANSLDPGQEVHLRLVVTARTEGSEDEDPLTIRATKEVKFTANEPPSGGDCTITTKAVSSKVLRVHLAAPGWTDPDGQVQYRFEIVKGDRVVARQNWRLFSTFTSTVMLKPGETAFGRCKIRDKYGDGGTIKTRSVSAP